MRAKPTIRLFLAGAAAFLMFISLAIAVARTKAPWEDESWFGSAAVTLASEGRLATSLIEGAGTWRAGTARHFYWEPPLSFVTNSIAYRLAGFSVLALRGASIFWGCLALVCCGLLVWKLTGRARAALLALFLISIDYFFILGASDARMDCMCFALGIAGLTSYMFLRERHLGAALVVSQAFVVMSGMSHPNGILWFACVAATVLMNDRQRLTPACLAYAAAPYMVGAVGWGLFINADPKDFVTQFVGNVKESSACNALGRSPLSAPVAGFLTEIHDRYLAPYGLLAGVGTWNRLKAIVLVIYVSAIAIAAAWSLRSQVPVRILLAMTLIVFLLLAFVTGNKWSRYLIHITPLWAMLLALIVDRALDRGAYFRTAAITVIVGIAVLQWGGVLYHVHQNTYARIYLPTARFVEQNSSSDSFIVGPAAFYWTLSEKRRFVNDLRLGYFTGERADVIVIDDWYRTLLLNGTGDMRPAKDYAQRMLSQDYEPKWTQGEYTVYLRKRSRTLRTASLNAKTENVSTND